LLRTGHGGRGHFAEMEPFTVKAGDADYSRDVLFSRLAGE
jgi:hypothetical protein